MFLSIFQRKQRRECGSGGSVSSVFATESNNCATMAKNNFESGRTAVVGIFGASPRKSQPSTPRSSPVRVRSPNSSPPGSPGLMGGHYAGCKWTEPPLPSTLPPPPQHWMQAPHSMILPFLEPPCAQIDIASQLKVLLKVQA